MGCYSLLSFYVARTLLLLPLDLAFPTMWTTGFFWITNLRPDVWVYVQVLLLVYVSFSTYQGIGLAISASGMPPLRSGTLSILLITYFFAWSGFFMAFEHVPAWLVWASEINPFKASVDLMMHIIMQGDLVFDCGTWTGPGDGSKMGVGCVESSGGASVLSGRDALVRHGITSNPWHCVMIVSALLIGCRLLAFVVLWWDLRTAITGAKEAQSVSQGEVSSQQPQWCEKQRP